MIRTLARPLLASAFAVDGAQMLKDSTKYSEEAAAITGQLRSVLPPNISTYIPKDAETNARILGGVKVAAAAALATGKASFGCHHSGRHSGSHHTAAPRVLVRKTRRIRKTRSVAC